MDDCGGCALWTNRGPNMVPYGEGQVNEGDYWECSEGYTDCPEGAFVPAEPHYAVRGGHGLDEEQWEEADYEREMMLDQ